MNRRLRCPRWPLELGEALREEAGIEDRLEYLDGKLEVFESIYEMVSQRLADCTHNKQGLGVEWLIVALLAAEVILGITALVAEHVCAGNRESRTVLITLRRDGFSPRRV